MHVEIKGYHIPDFAVPAGYTPATYLREMCMDGLKWRFGDSALSDATLMKRLN